MSFMDNLGKMEGMLGGASPAEASAAAADHVNAMDPSELSGHLQQSLGSMDPSSLSALGGHLLQAFDQHGQGGDQAAQAAGTSTDAVASGNTGAIGSLIQMAESHPQILQAAAGHFFGSNPGAIGQMAPGLLSGIMGRLGR